MRKTRAGIVCLLACAAAFTARPAKAGSNAVPAAAQAQCAAFGPAKGEGKFTGQISSVTNGGAMEVISGNQSLQVHYNNSVEVCEAGRPASVNALARGANVVVYGPMTRNGNVLEMTATKILITGLPQVGMRGNEPINASNAGATPAGARPINNSNVAMTNGSQGSGTTARDDWNSGAGAGGATGGQATGGAQGNQNSSNATRIACSGLQFTVGSSRSASRMGAGRTSISGVICKMAVDQLAVQLMQDAMTAKRLQSLTLSCQNELEVSLTDAEVSQVEFTWDNAAEIAEVTFAAQKVEVVHPGSGTRVGVTGTSTRE
jgi:type VI protein secretion system component Hcp